MCNISSKHHYNGGGLAGSRRWQIGPTNWWEVGLVGLVGGGIGGRLDWLTH